MNHKQVAEAFANGKTKANGSRMFIDGDTIYSYGYHFAIARWLPDGSVLWNYNDYSSSTQRHKYHVSRALQGIVKVEVNNPKDGILSSDASYHYDEAVKAAEKLIRARVEHSKSYWGDKYTHHQEQAMLVQRLLTPMPTKQSEIDNEIINVLEGVS